MQVNVADVGHLRKKLTLRYTTEEVGSRRAQVLRQLGGEVRLNGFRPGKTATAVVEKRYGAAATSKVEEQLLDEGVKQALKEHQLKPIGPFENEEVGRTDGLTVVVSFDVKPAIALPTPGSLGLSEPAVEVPQTDIDERFLRLCRRIGETTALTGAETISEDDTITVDGTVSTKEGGVLVKELKGFQHLVGSIPLFGVAPAAVVAALAGKKVGDRFELEGSVPTSFSAEEHRGKPAALSLTIVSAERLRQASGEEVAKRLNLADEAAVRAQIALQLKNAREAQMRQELVQAMMTKLVDNITVEIPAKLLENATLMLESQAKRASQAQTPTAGGAMPAALPETPEAQLAREQAAKELPERAAKNVRRFLIVDAIIESRQVTVTREDLEDQIRMAAMQSGRPPEEVAKRLQDSGQINQVVQEIREAKAIELFLDEALGKPVVAAAPAHGEIGHVHGPDCQH